MRTKEQVSKEFLNALPLDVQSAHEAYCRRIDFHALKGVQDWLKSKLQELEGQPEDCALPSIHRAVVEANVFLRDAGIMHRFVCLLHDSEVVVSIQPPFPPRSQ